MGGPSEEVASALTSQRAEMMEKLFVSWLWFFLNKSGVKSSAERERMERVFG